MGLFDIFKRKKHKDKVSEEKQHSENVESKKIKFC